MENIATMFADWMNGKIVDEEELRIQPNEELNVLNDIRLFHS
jgi:hypothetical protein